MSDYRVWHVSYLCQALEKYREHHSTVKGSMTIEDFKEEIANALEELGMWDNTGNRS